eukprot:747204-Hanusia_phi.AAC.2
MSTGNFLYRVRPFSSIWFNTSDEHRIRKVVVHKCQSVCRRLGGSEGTAVHCHSFPLHHRFAVCAAQTSAVTQGRSSEQSLPPRHCPGCCGWRTRAARHGGSTRCTQEAGDMISCA